MLPLTPLQSRLEELKKLAGEATPGPWNSDYCGDVWTEGLPAELDERLGMKVFRMIGTTPKGPDPGDGAFIAASRTELPRFIEALEDAVKALEKIDTDHCTAHPSDLVQYRRGTAREALARITALLTNPTVEKK